MKKTICLLTAGLLALTATTFTTSFFNASADTAEGAVDLFAEEGSWKHNSSGSTNSNAIVFENGEMTLTPRSTIGSTYTGRAMGQGRISFSYQITPQPEDNYDLTTEDGRAEWFDDIKDAQVFFGVTFLNSPRGVSPSASLAIPFNEGAGGFPYMVALDTEKQNGGDNPAPERNRQLGLTVRRYKYDGSHDFTRWSSVEPTNATYLNSSNVEYESKIPDYHKAVGLEDCFDTELHTVDVDVKNLYVSAGDAVDAVQIEVYFDGELSLRVIDEMPFETDKGKEEFLDKRTRDGYISIYTHGGTQDTAAEDMEYYSVTFKSFTAVFGESNGGVDSGEQGGCSSTTATGLVTATGIAVIGMAIALCTLIKKKVQ